MIYEKAQENNTKDIVKLHKTGIPTGFLSKQSNSFLEALYEYLIKTEVVYVAKDKERVVGFVAVSKNTAGLYKRFLKSNVFLLLNFSIRNIFSIEFIKKSFETLLAPKKTAIDDSIDIPELLSIVVDKEYHKRGVGKNLLNCIEKELIVKGFKQYKVLVGANLEANIFYKKNGFIKIKEVELHKGIKSFIYIKNIA